MHNNQECWQSRKSGSCWQITFAAREDYPEDLSMFLEEYFEVLSTDYTDDGLEQYIAYQNRKFDETDLLQAAQSAGVELPDYQISFLESQNWLKDYVIEFPPVEVEDFLIYGIHEKEAPKTDKLTLKIYAATAFGSSHQTTQCCLRAISWINGNTGICNQQPMSNTDFSEVDRSKSRSTEAECTSCVHEHSSTGICNQQPDKIRILDVGTGSGILSLAAAKLWQEAQITAVDIDEEAVWVTRQNALDNHLQNQFVIEVSDGYNSEAVRNGAPYDLIFSNILARPLIEMAPDLYKNLKKGGLCILSGFIDEQVDWILDAHKKQGLKPVKIFEMDNWRAAVMEK